MNQHSIVTTYKNEGGSIFITQQTINGDLSQNVEQTIPIGSVDAEFDVNIPASQLLSFGAGCVKNRLALPGTNVTSLTIKTNSSSTPDETLVITPSGGIAWCTGSPPSITQPITIDVTKIFVTLLGDAPADLSIRALIDSTPVLT